MSWPGNESLPMVAAVMEAETVKAHPNSGKRGRTNFNLETDSFFSSERNELANSCDVTTAALGAEKGEFGCRNLDQTAVGRSSTWPSLQKAER